MTVSTERKEYLALWRRENQDRIREQARQWRQNNPEKCREQNAERQRKRREAEKAGIAPKKQSTYKYRRYEEGLITVAMVQAEERHLNPPPNIKRECDCRDYRNCTICRNAEKRRAARAGDIPAYRREILVSIIGG